jgi:hypothetical protein
VPAGQQQRGGGLDVERGRAHVQPQPGAVDAAAVPDHDQGVGELVDGDGGHAQPQHHRYLDGMDAQLEPLAGSTPHRRVRTPDTHLGHERPRPAATHCPRLIPVQFPRFANGNQRQERRPADEYPGRRPLPEQECPLGRRPGRRPCRTALYRVRAGAAGGAGGAGRFRAVMPASMAATTDSATLTLAHRLSSASTSTHGAAG